MYTLDIGGLTGVCYYGGRNVAVLGPRVDSISPESIRDILSAMRDMGFLSLQDRYVMQVTDAGMTVISLRIGNSAKTVWFSWIPEFADGYHIDTTVLQGLDALAAKIDGAARSARWTEAGDQSPADERGH
jgi:hypothetical protein